MTYRGDATFTNIRFDFTTQGKVKNAWVERKSCVKGDSCYDNCISISKEVIEEYFEQENLSEKLLKYLYTNYRFNKHGDYYFY